MQVRGHGETSMELWFADVGHHANCECGLMTFLRTRAAVVARSVLNGCRRRNVSTAATPLIHGTRVFANGEHEEFALQRQEFVSCLGLPPRDLRLLVNRGAHIAVRPSYYLFNFPPFLSGLCTSDEAVLITSYDAHDDDDERMRGHQEAARLATLVLRAGITTSLQHIDQPFEHAVLESVLREGVMRKQERIPPAIGPCIRRGGFSTVRIPCCPVDSA